MKRIVKATFILTESSKKRPIQKRGELVDELRKYAKDHKMLLALEYLSVE
jgi:hypothetical protein